jgi:hypothetical protein
VAGRVGQGGTVTAKVEVEVTVVVIVRAVGFEREVVRVSSRRVMRVDVRVEVAVGPAQGGREVGRGAR